MKLNEFIKLNEGIHDKGLFKAIILIGGPGAGKSYILNKAIKSPEWMIINPDVAYEKYMKKDNIPLDSRKQTDLESNRSTDNHDKSNELISKKASFHIKGRLPIVIDKTGRDKVAIGKVKNQLESIGYEVLAIYIKVKKKTAIRRNNNRDRTVDLFYVNSIHDDINKNITFYKKLFNKNLLIIENEDDSKNDFHKIWVNINNWMKRPVNNEIAKRWKENELSKFPKTK